jgi:hypothetical protein
MPLLQEGPDPIQIQYKFGLGASGAIVGGIIGAAVGGCQSALVVAIAAGLIGIIGGAFADGDYQTSIYCTSPQQERAWATVGYVVLFGLGFTIFGIVLTLFVPDWRPLLIAAGGMFFVVIALSYGGSLAKR